MPQLQEVDELLEQPTDLVGLVAPNADLVAADADLGTGKGVFDLAEVLIAGTDESGHQVRARHDDSRRCSSCRHEVVGTVTSFPGRISRSLVARSCAGRPGSTLIAHRSVAVIGDPRW